MALQEDRGTGPVVWPEAPLAPPPAAVTPGGNPAPSVVNPKDATMRPLPVSAGEALFGSAGDDSDAQDDERPQIRATPPSRDLGETEVTKAQCKRFGGATGHRPPGLATHGAVAWTGASLRAQCTNHPVQCVRCDGAKAYCDWVGFRLPSGLECKRGARACFALPLTDGMRRAVWRAGRRPQPRAVRRGVGCRRGFLARRIPLMRSPD
jgi:formylglycine-generating enzyme required for sulfatase activity